MAITKRDIESVFEFMSQVYKVNWETRWSKTPFMDSFAKKEDLKSFVDNSGKFESVIGHVWSCIGFWILFEKICPSLSSLVNNKALIEKNMVT